MSEPKRMNHLARSLQWGGYYPKDKPLPFGYTETLRKSLFEWLEWKKPEDIKKSEKLKRIKDVRRVINAFRTIQADAFRDVEPTGAITRKIDKAVREFDKKHRTKVPLSREMENMPKWELYGSMA